MINETLSEIRASRGRQRRAPEVLDLLVLREFERVVEGDEDANVSAVELGDVASLASWCWRCASATYGFGLLKGLGLLPGALPNTMGDVLQLDMVAIRHRCGDVTVLKKSVAGTFLAPAFFVAYSPSRTTAVVAIRGTVDLGDALTDLVCRPAPLGEGFAHAGMAEAAKAVVLEITDAVNEAVSAGATQIVFTGHSLGGGVALLAAVLFRDRTDCPVRAVAFAPPPVVTDAHDDGLTSFFVGDDVVPHLSLGSIVDLVKEIDALDDVVSPRERLDLLLAAKASARVVSVLGLAGDAKAKLKAAVDAARSAAFSRTAPNEPLLKVPGQQIHLTRDGLAKRRAPVAPKIRIKDRAILDHLPTTIEPALNAFLRPLDDVNSSSSDEDSRPGDRAAEPHPPPRGPFASFDISVSGGSCAFPPRTPIKPRPPPLR